MVVGHDVAAVVPHKAAAAALRLRQVGTVPSKQRPHALPWPGGGDVDHAGFGGLHFATGWLRYCYWWEGASRCTLAQS